MPLFKARAIIIPAECCTDSEEQALPARICHVKPTALDYTVSQQWPIKCSSGGSRTEPACKPYPGIGTAETRAPAYPVHILCALIKPYPSSVRVHSISQSCPKQASRSTPGTGRALWLFMGVAHSGQSIPVPVRPKLCLGLVTAKKDLSPCFLTGSLYL